MNPHIYDAHMDDELHLAGEVPEQVEGTPPPPPPPFITDLPEEMKVSLLLMVAKEETQVWRGHCARLAELWDAMGVMGLVCAKQERVTEFLAHLHTVKGILKG